jgi:ADP-heptose:LPS heptosyltransferase
MKKYCVIQLGSLTDLFQTKRLILSLGKEQGQVHLVVPESLQEQAAILYPEVVLHIVSGEVQSLEELQRNPVSVALQQEEFTAVYNLHETQQNMLLSSLFSPKIMKGYWQHDEREYCDTWLRCLSRVQGRQRFLNVMDRWAHLCEAPVPSHMVNPIAMRKGGGIGVVLRDVTGQTLPVEVLAGCVNAVCTASREAKVILFGEAGDEELVKALLPLLKEKVAANAVDRCFESSFEEDMDSISTLDMLVTADCSLMHAAAHVGTPVNAFFHSSAWCMENGPYGLGHRVWQADTSCAPCSASSSCAENYSCMHVFGEEQLQRFLAGKIDQNYPQGVTGYVSMLDEVGVTYMPVFGAEEHAVERLALRGVASEFVGIAKLSKTVAAGCANFYVEQDWLLPHCSKFGGDDA